MGLTVTADKPGRADHHGGVIADSPGTLRKTGDDHHPAPFRKLDQPLGGWAIRHRLRQREDFLLRYELVAGGTQLGQDDQICVSPAECLHNPIEIVRHLAELWSELVKADPHRL